MTAADEMVYVAVNMTANNRLEFQFPWSIAETKETTRSINDTDCIISQAERENDNITSNEDLQLLKESSNHLIRSAAWKWTIDQQQL